MHMKPMMRMMKQMVARMMMATNRPMCELHIVSLLAAVRAAAGGATVASMSAGMPPYSVTSDSMGWGRNGVLTGLKTLGLTTSG